MSLEALAENLRQGDPDRFAMAMIAPAAARPRLLTLYALNLELARTALAASAGLMAEMRVQWWIDRLSALSEAPPPPHELLTPLYSAWGARAAGFAALAQPRRHDAWRVPFDSAGEVADYVGDTAGMLMVAAAEACGADAKIARDQGFGAGMAAWLRARPALEALNLGLAGADRAALAELAGQGLAALARAAAARKAVPRSAAGALYPGAGAGAVLRALSRGDAPPVTSEFARRAGLARLALLGRWWVAS